ncbi:MAG: transporter substrate-binding domain-containing protein [Dialister sp.]|nr:transporter substrate-binding domain-containing protein [Dialister sp.]
MKTMWKVLAAGMAMAAVVGLSGCGGSDPSKAPAGNAQQGALMKQIKEKGKLVVGTASGYPPYEFVDAAAGDKKVIGIDIAFAQQIADKLGVKLEVQDMNFQALLASLVGGKVDVAIAGINPTDERRKTMDFSAEYLPTAEMLIIRKTDAGKYKTLEGLTGKAIGVQKSTTQEETAKTAIKNAKIIALAHVPEVILELKQGKIDGVVVEGIVGRQYLVYNDDLQFAEVTFPNSVKASAVALTKGNDDLKALINQVIKENSDNGNFEKWADEYSRKAVENASK